MSRPTLHQFEIFCKVIKLGNMSRAAEELYLTPSSVTIQIRQLEQKYQTQLLVRSSRGVVPTIAGRALYKRAASVLRDVDAAESELDAMQSLDGGLLQFSASRTIGTYFVPSVLALFQRAHPNVKVEYVIKSGSDEARFAVLDRVAEFAVLGRTASDSVLTIDALLGEPMHVVAAPTHPFALLEGRDLGDLLQHTLLLRQGPILARDFIERQIAEARAAARILEFSNTEAIKQAAIEGRGVAVLPHSSVRQEIATGALVTRVIDGFAPTRTAYVARSANVPLSAAATAFLAMAEEFNKQAGVAFGQ